MKQKITFDRFIRGVLIALGVVAAIFIINRLSNVLLPFVIAWLLAYLIYPFVRFFEVKCKLKNRVLSIIVTLVCIVAVLSCIFMLLVPPILEQFSVVKELIVNYINNRAKILGTGNIEQYIKDFLQSKGFQKLLDGVDVMGILQEAIAKAANLVSQTASILLSIFSACIVILYLFFILLDYEQFAEGWKKFVPVRQRGMATRISGDVIQGMNRYFRGQSLIAFIVGILFAIGFTLIGLPMGIALGLFIGVLNLVPYLQTIGFIPAVVLALLKASNTGQNFWVILLLILLVFLVVQSIQDLFLTPKIMGKMMGMNPAGILLSLSVWGSLLGFIGLIIALPLTTLLISYYRNYIIEDERKVREEEEKRLEGACGAN